MKQVYKSCVLSSLKKSMYVEGVCEASVCSQESKQLFEVIVLSKYVLGMC